MTSIAVDAQSIKRRGDGGGVISITAAAGLQVDQIEADLCGQPFGMLV